MTPPLLFITSYISLSEIRESNLEFQKKWGSLFNEFKNDRGFLSSQYYLLYFLRRAVYVLVQVYLNSYLLLQGSLNILGSLGSLLFLFWYRPFKQTPVLISNFVGEITISIVMISTYCYLWDISDETEDLIEKLVIFSVISSMVVQYIVSMYILGQTLLTIWRKLEKERSLAFMSRAVKTLSNHVQHDELTKKGD